MVYSVPLLLFEDDVSGNISKQWNKHYVIYMSNANLPRQMLEKEFCVRFVTSSPHASPLELMAAVKQSILYVISLEHKTCGSDDSPNLILKRVKGFGRSCIRLLR